MFQNFQSFLCSFFVFIRSFRFLPEQNLSREWFFWCYFRFFCSHPLFYPLSLLEALKAMWRSWYVSDVFILQLTHAILLICSGPINCGDGATAHALRHFDICNGGFGIWRLQQQQQQQQQYHHHSTASLHAGWPWTSKPNCSSKKIHLHQHR